MWIAGRFFRTEIQNQLWNAKEGKLKEVKARLKNIFDKNGILRIKLAERAGFEPAVHLLGAYNRLAGDRFRPLSHLSVFGSLIFHYEELLQFVIIKARSVC